jgi:hypothetical protein
MSTTAARRLLAAIVIGFSVAALVNIGWEINLQQKDRAVLGRADSRLSTLAGTERVLARERYWIAAALVEAGHGGTLVVPEASLVDGYLIANLPQMELRVEGYSCELGAAEAEALFDFPHIAGVASLKPHEDKQPFLVVWKNAAGPAPTIRLWCRDQTVYLVDDRVIEEITS